MFGICSDYTPIDNKENIFSPTHFTKNVLKIPFKNKTFPQTSLQLFQCLSKVRSQQETCRNGTFDISPEICSKKTIKSGGVGACTFILLNLYLFTVRAFIFFSWISHIKNDIAKRLFTNELQCSSILMFDLKTARKICPTRNQCIKLFLLVVISFCCWHLGKNTM